jgi:hypothetical protein
MNDKIADFFKIAAELFVASIFLAGGLVSATIATQAISTYVSSFSWPSVQGVIHNSNVEYFSCGDAHTCVRPVIRVDYVVGDQRYQAAGHSFKFSAGNTFIEYSAEQAEAIVRQHQPNSSVSMLVNPGNPQEFIIERRFSWLGWAFCEFSGLFMLGIGIWGIAGQIWDMFIYLRRGRTVFAHLGVKSFLKKL